MKGITTADIEAALRRHDTCLEKSAEALGIQLHVLLKRIYASDHLKKVMFELRTVKIEEAQKGLVDAADRGDTWAIQFVLRTLGRPLGYKK